MLLKGEAINMPATSPAEAVMNLRRERLEMFNGILTQLVRYIYLIAFKHLPTYEDT